MREIGCAALIGFAALLLSVSGGVQAADNPDAQKASDLFKDAVGLGKDRKYAEARAKYEECIKLYENVLKGDPKNKSAARNVEAAKNNILWTYGADAYDKLSAGKKLFEESKYEETATTLGEAVKAYELARKMNPKEKRYDANLKYVTIKSRAARGLAAVAAKGPAPDFALPDLDGKTVKLSDLRGKVVLLDFWAVWCPPCRELVPVVEELYQKHKDEGFMVLGLNVDKTEGYNKGSANKVAEFAKEQIQYPVLWATNEVVWDYGDVPSVPTVFLIDKEGKIYRQYKTEERTKETMEKDILTLLGQ